MKKRVLVSVVAFSAFALLGPVIWSLCPPAVRSGYEHLDQQVFALIVLTFPTILFSSGKPTPPVMNLTEANIALFAAIGALVGLLARGVTRLLLVYLAMCALLIGLEGYYAGFRLNEFKWPAFAVALVLYAFPFAVIFWYGKRRLNV